MGLWNLHKDTNSIPKPKIETYRHFVDPAVPRILFDYHDKWRIAVLIPNFIILSEPPKNVIEQVKYNASIDRLGQYNK